MVQQQEMNAIATRVRDALAAALTAEDLAAVDELLEAGEEGFAALDAMRLTPLEQRALPADVFEDAHGWLVTDATYLVDQNTELFGTFRTLAAA